MGSEECDDGNTETDDGCTSVCAVTLGYEFILQNTLCEPICGDGLKLGTEECEDNNGASPVSGDGCSDQCQIE